MDFNGIPSIGTTVRAVSLRNPQTTLDLVQVCHMTGVLKLCMAMYNREQVQRVNDNDNKEQIPTGYRCGKGHAPTRNDNDNRSEHNH